MLKSTKNNQDCTIQRTFSKQETHKNHYHRHSQAVIVNRKYVCETICQRKWPQNLNENSATYHKPNGQGLMPAHKEPSCSPLRYYYYDYFQSTHNFTCKVPAQSVITLHIFFLFRPSHCSSVYPSL